MKEKARRIAYPLAFLAFAFVVALNTAYSSRPLDSDALFLIENGRYILENGIPHTNPWASVEGLGIIIQQPLCSILNYLWSSLFGLQGMWALAILENAVLLACLVVFGRLFCKDTGYLLEGVAIFEIFAGSLGIVTTRPYQLTIAVSLLFLTSLVNFKRSKKTGKDRAVLTASVFALSLFQANYQAAFVPMLALWSACFFAPDLSGAFQELGQRRPMSAVRCAARSFVNNLGDLWTVPVAYLFAVICNPYGLNGAAYLLKSREAMSMVGAMISEVRSPEMSSAIHMGLVLGTLVSVYFLRKKLPSWQIYMALGCDLLVCMSHRNAWMGAVALLSTVLVKLGELKRPEGKRRPKLEAVLLTFAVVFPALCIVDCLSKPADISSVYDSAVVSYLDENAKKGTEIYTTFNNGAVLEYAGYRVFMDARPELFTPDITGGRNVLKEWYEVEYGDADPGEFLTESGFEYCYVGKDSRTELALRYGGLGYELVCSGECGELYRKTDDN